MADETIDYSGIKTALDAIAETKLYADLKSDYEGRLIEHETYVALRTAFNEKALAMAFDLTAKIILSGGNFKAKSDAELEEIKAKTDFAINQTLTEEERKKLIIKQRVGFDDNMTIERYKAGSEVIGMILSGGNEAPVELWTELSAAIARVALVESRHEEG